MLGKGLIAKNFNPVTLLFVVSKVLLIINIVTCKYSQSTTHLLTVVSDKTVQVFNRSRATQPVVLDISMVFDRIWHATLLHKLSFMEFQVRYLPSVINDFKWCWMGSYNKDIQLIASVSQGSILILILLYINELPDDVICNIAIYADDTTLYSKCNQASDQWQ